PGCLPPFRRRRDRAGRSERDQPVPEHERPGRVQPGHRGSCGSNVTAEWLARSLLPQPSTDHVAARELARRHARDASVDADDEAIYSARPRSRRGSSLLSLGYWNDIDTVTFA